eukprot:3879165-Alexandrium_andersonii.AAC.1
MRLAISSSADISFADGGPVPKAGAGKYLGVMIEASGGYVEELAKKVGLCRCCLRAAEAALRLLCH